MLYMTAIARVCHEANRAYCLAMGDLSAGPWDMLPEDAKEGVLSGVKAAYANPSMTPAEAHQAWMQEKTAKGWKYAPLKAPDRLEHPCLLPFDQLSKEHQAKDALFLAIVYALRSVTQPPIEQCFTPVEPPAEPPAEEPPAEEPPPEEPPADPPPEEPPPEEP